ncbi:glucose import [Tritrichomonas musculus]|uniref:Glucose import n=1 Tax=Tritrichomonas musculus TaxID=1915356 RepID=A0ABR2JDP5_9EUKA
MVSFSRALSYTLVHMLGSFTFGFITIFPTPGVRSMQVEWPYFNSIVDQQSIRFFNSFAPLFASLGGFLVHILIRYVFNSHRRIVICILNVFGVVIWLYF